MKASEMPGPGQLSRVALRASATPSARRPPYSCWEKTSEALSIAPSATVSGQVQKVLRLCQMNF